MLIKFYFIVILFYTITISSPKISGSLILVNDNITNSLERGINGDYIGADDFLTFSILNRMYYGGYKGSISWNIVTSRLKGYRYDLLTTTISKEFLLKHLSITGEVGTVIKGDLGGSYVQNGWHKRTGVPQIILPYQKQEFSFLTAINIKKNWENIFSNNDIVEIISELRVPFGIISTKIGIYGSYKIYPINILSFEILGGFRGFLNNVDSYSPFVKSGYIFATNSEVTIYKELKFNLGFNVTPANNIITDALYKQKEFSEFLQIYGGFSWAVKGKSLFEFLNY